MVCSLCDDGTLPKDFTIYSGEHCWTAHRFILAASSRFFEKLCYNGFKVRQTNSLDGVVRSFS